LRLCDCIAQSAQNLPGYYFPIYCCKNWAGEMMACAALPTTASFLPINQLLEVAE
jgi:hypothetical protein